MEAVGKWLDKNKELIKKTALVAWPAVLESFFVAFVGMVDSMMVSRLGEYAVAEVCRTGAFYRCQRGGFRSDGQTAGRRR